MITCLLMKINLLTICIWQTCRRLQISRSRCRYKYKHEDKFKFKLKKLKYEIEIKFFATHQ